MVCNYELGANYPPIPTLIKLAKVLEVGVDRLLGVEEERPSDIQDRRLHQLFKEADNADITTQGLVKQVVERLLISAKSLALRTGTDG
jgi:transcriptional regulator with XRE-family HTH domain